MTGGRKRAERGCLRIVGRHVAVLCVFSLLALSGAAHAASPAASDLAGLRERIKAAFSALTHARGEAERLQDDVNAAEQQLGHARAQLAQIQAQRAAVEAKLKDIEAQTAALQQQIDQQRQALATQLRAEYRLGANDPLQALLSGTDPGTVGRLFADYAYMHRERAAALATLRSRQAALAALESQQDAERERLVAMQHEQEAALAELQQSKQQRAAAVAAMKAKIDRKGEELDSLRAAEKHMQDLLAQAQQQAAERRAQERAERQARQQSRQAGAGPRTPPAAVAGPQGAFATLRGRLLRPVAGPLLARFGASRAGGPLTWKGTWIGAPRGAAVRASARGRVVHVGWVSSYGLIVLVDHGHGYFTLYGHVDRATVRVGDNVAAGQAIATAGDTGGYDRTGVYFEIRHDGRPLDPGVWFKR
ncbi:MAG: hypothetical protein EPN72_07910 [Nevskiaceae bacterium]|nr:MAG: hypothetical protein EPN63_04700 [Nevskiaceae bacterium]TBR73082.1 MAG: hypothetical protein EPN72_07910 [Nevskiaceae bacterium]